MWPLSTALWTRLGGNQCAVWTTSFSNVSRGHPRPLGRLVWSLVVLLLLLLLLLILLARLWFSFRFLLLCLLLFEMQSITAGWCYLAKG